MSVTSPGILGPRFSLRTIQQSLYNAMFGAKIKISPALYTCVSKSLNKFGWISDFMMDEQTEVMTVSRQFFLTKGSCCLGRSIEFCL